MSDSELTKLKVFGMQNLMLEAELRNLERSGIELGHSQTLKLTETVDPELFEADIRKDAIKMANFYVIYYSFENTVRRLIGGRLEGLHGSNWWEDKIPQAVRDEVKKKQTQERDTTMTIRSDNPLSYASYGELITILENNWVDFADTLRSRKSAINVLSQFGALRNVIAHSCVLADDEIERLQLLIKDWFRIQS